MIRLHLLLASLVLLALAGAAQESTTAAPEAADGAVADEFVWTTDWEDARAQARIGDRDVLMVFAGSDWCRPCKMFKASILEDSTFQRSASEEIVVLYLDFPSRKKNQLPAAQQEHNQAFAKRYNAEGLYPKLVLLTPTEQRLGELEFRDQGSEAFLAELAAARRVRANGR